jgi:hypothetical protein
VSELPEITRLRGAVHRQTPDGGDVSLADAEQAVRDAVERAHRNGQAKGVGITMDAKLRYTRDQTVRECVEALRAEQERERYAFDDGWDAAADFIERTMLGEGA